MTRSRTLFRTATEPPAAVGGRFPDDRPPDDAGRVRLPPEPRPTRIVVEESAGRARFSVLDQGLYLAPRPVHGSADPLHLRVALIGIHMMLLGGDDVRIEVSVGAGVTLEVVEPAGLVAYDSEGVSARWSLQADVGRASTLIWDGASFVAAAGSNVHRELRVRMDAGARALVRETLVLGRSGEYGGQLRSVTRISGPGGDCLYEDLDLTGPRVRAVGIMGSSKVMASATAAGWRPAALPPPAGSEPHRVRRFELAAPGAVARSLSSQAHTGDGEIDGVFSAWREELAGFGAMA